MPETDVQETDGENDEQVIVEQEIAVQGNDAANDGEIGVQVI